MNRWKGKPRLMRISGILGLVMGAALCLMPFSCGTAATPISSTPAVAVDASMREHPPLHLSPLREGTWKYQVTDGDGKGKVVTQVVKFKPSDKAAPWQRDFSVNRIIAHLRQELDGSIVMTSNEILDHDVLNVFDPPQIVLPAPDALFTPVHLTSKVVTSLRSRPTFHVDHGTAELSLTPGGTETIQTPAGKFVCQRMDLRLHLKFGLGDVQSMAKIYYADKVGVVAETYEENTVSFFLKSKKSWKILLIEYPE